MRRTYSCWSTGLHSSATFAQHVRPENMDAQNSVISAFSTLPYLEKRGG